MGDRSEINKESRLEELEKEVGSLRKEVSFLSDLLDTVDDTVFIFDPATGQPLYWNKAFREVSGFTDDEIVARRAPDDWYDEEDLKRAADAMGKLAITEHGRVEMALRTKSDERVSTEYSAALMKNVHGTERAIVAIGRDVTDRKQTEAELKSSRSVIDRLIEETPYPTWISDNRGTMIRINQACCDLFTVKQEEIVGKYNVFEDEGIKAQGLIPLVRRVFENAERVSFALNYDSANVDAIELEQTAKAVFQVTLFPLLSETGEVANMVVQNIDLTELARTRDALQSSEAKFAEIAAAIPGAVYQLVRHPDGSVSVPFVSSGVRKLLGVTPASIQKDISQFFDAIHPDDLEMVQEAFASSAQHLTKYSLENRMLIGGETRWLAQHAVPHELPDGSVLWNGVSIDVTEKRLAAEALHKSERRYLALLEAIPDVVVVLDQELNHVMFNEATVKLSGKSREELARTSSRDLFPGYEETVFFKAITRVLETREPEVVLGQLLFKDEPRWTQMTVYPLPEGVMYFSRDVTEQKLVEDRLRQAQKLEAIGTLAGGIAHDFNNLLMGIQGRVSLMLYGLDPEHIHHTHLEEIEHVVQSATDLTRQLLGFARGGKYEVKPTNLNELILRCVSMFSRTRKEIKFHTKTRDDLWSVEVDRGQIEQVLLNLFVNGWQAMAHGGEIFVETDNVELDEAYVKPHRLKSGKFVKISVTDTGEGMTPETIERVFEPFFTTKEMGHGAGLGLASSYGIVKNHSGIINVYSEPGQGATFNVYLPASSAAVHPEPSQTQAASVGSEMILLIDDEKTVRDVTSLMLVRLGYHVRVASSGAQGLELFKKDSEKIHLVLLDMILPGENTLEIFAGLRTLKPSVKVLLCSGYSINGQASTILSHGCDGFIQKPFQLSKLSSKIRELLDG